MDIVRERFHVRESLIGMERTVPVPHSLPAVIDFDIDVTRRAQARFDQRVGRSAYILIGHPRSELLPAGPTHQRGLGQIVGRQVTQLWQWKLFRRGRWSR